MTAVRAGASSVLLQDGRVLITGGNGGAGSLASAEFMNADGTFTAAPSMSFARAGHSSTVLANGTVLVAGGIDASGAPSQTAEIFDPVANTWSSAPPLMVPRSGHTATVLTDGCILLAGGVSAGGPTASLEIYDPASGAFADAGSSLSTPRQNHAAALLADGRVLIVGGSDGTNPLASSDIFDPSANPASAVTAGPTLATARFGLSATTLLDGTVLVAGGTTSVTSGTPPVTTQQDTASAEIMDAAATTFSAAPSSLVTARSGHLAFRLPHNNAVLIVGGTSNGTALNSTELYMPWTGAFTATGSMGSARTAATGSTLSTDGILMVAGGLDTSHSPLATSEVYGFATIKTDQSDYPPGTTVNITGSGWQPNETVQLNLVEDPDVDADSPILIDAVADANGNISDSSFSTNAGDINISITLTAAGAVSQAQTKFTDAVKEYEATIAPTSDTAGHTLAGYTVTIKNDPSSTNNFASATISVPVGYTSVVLGAVTPPTGSNWTASLSSGVITLSGNTGSDHLSAGQSVSVALTATVPCTDGSYQWTTATAGNFAIQGSQPSVAVSGSCTVPTTTTVTSSLNPSTYGQSVSFTATVAPSTGSTAPTGTIQFVVDGVNLGSSVALTASGSNGVASSSAISSLDVAHSPHSVVANYTPSGVFTGTGGSLSGGQTVNKANATFTVTPYDVTYNGLEHAATVGTITGVNGETGATVGTVDLTNTKHTNAGTYSSDSWSFTGTANYNNQGPTTITDKIEKADATFTVTPYDVTYNGLEHAATVGTITGVNGETGATVGTVDLTNTKHTNAGTYSSDSWSFTGGANYNDQGPTTIADKIAKANATVVVTPYTAPGTTYTGLPHTATVTSITGVNGENGGTVGTVDVSHTTHTDAGTYASDYWVFTGTANYNDIASTTITDSIAKATAVVVVTPYTVTYDTSPHTAAVTSITGVNGETGATVGTVDVSNTTHTNAGTYNTDTWSFTGTANYNNIASTTITDTINKATPIVTWSNPANITYGTALSGTQLNATFTWVGTVAGTATYTPPAGTILPPGQGQTLSVNFAPSDTTNYNAPPTKTVTINVLFAGGGLCSNGLASHIILQPINADGTSVFKMGSTVPTKFAVCDANGNSVGPNAAFPNQNVVASYRIVSIASGTITNVLDSTIDSTTPDTMFRWDPTAQQWIFNTKTGIGTLSQKNATYLFQITLIDGTVIGSSGPGGVIPSVPFASAQGYQYGLR